MRAYERLLKYMVIPTPSDEKGTPSPTTPCQYTFAGELKKDMEELGLQDVRIDDHCYVYGRLIATPGFENTPSLGLIAHMDTVSDFCRKPINPCLTKDYDGGRLLLGDSGRFLDPENFPHLADLKGQTLITSDGHTILGVDDKAGIAEILTLVERLNDCDISHGPIDIAFTPDEETGHGCEFFDVKGFGSSCAYTLDGEVEGEIQYENFNGCQATFTIRGFSVHPGSSKDTMINASLVAMEINSLLPGTSTPRDTDGYEGFYHLIDMSGDCGSATLRYIVRDHDDDLFQNKKKTLTHIAETLNDKWGEGTVTLIMEDQYYNMAKIISEHMHLIENAREACTRAGVMPLIIPIRGGTDGCKLSYKGIPCPNLGTGGHAYHGPYEHITIEAMDKCVNILIELVKLQTE